MLLIGQPDLIVDERLGDIIRGARPHGLDCRDDRGKGRHHYHRRFRADVLGLLQDLEPVHLLHLDVGHDDVEVFLPDAVKRLLAVVRFLDRVSLLGEDDVQGHADVFFIVDDQNIRLCP